MKILRIILVVSILALGAIFINFEKDGSIELAAEAAGWSQTSGPIGGTVLRMINNNGKIWASLYSGGIYELQTTGKWKQIAIGHGIPEVRGFDIVVNPINPKVAYVPEMIGCAGKTVDGGLNWTGLCDAIVSSLSLDAPNFSAHTAVLDPDDPNIIYMPGHIHDQTSMVLMSKDAGATWSILKNFNRHYDFNQIVFYKSKMYLGTESDGLLVSSDKGKTWTAMNKGLIDANVGRFVNFKNSFYLLGVGIEYNTRVGGHLYKLNGNQWTIVSTAEDLTGIGTDGTTLYVGDAGGQMYSSSDGINFSKKSDPIAAAWVGEITILGSKIYAGVGGNGVFVSSDGAKTFKEYNKEMPSVATREIQVNRKDSNQIYAGTWDRLGFYWSKNGGKTYTKLQAKENILTIAADPRDFGRVYTAGDFFFVGTVKNGRGTFTEVGRPGSQGTVVKAIAVDPLDSNHILAGVADVSAETPPGEGLWESKDQGKTWKRSSGIGDFAVYSIIFNPANPKIVYAAALTGGVYKSTNGGTTFAKIGGDALKYTYRLAMSPSDPNILVAGSNVFFSQLSTEDQISGKYGGLFITKDGGNNWTELTAGIRDYGEDGPEDFKGWLYNFGHLPNYEGILIDPNDSNHLIVGHHGENVIVTTDGGETWSKPAEGMIPNNVHNYSYCLGSSADFKKIYSCTCGRGLFSGIVNSSGTIAWEGGSVAYAEESVTGPKNAKEALDIILSGDYNHQH